MRFPSVTTLSAVSPERAQEIRALLEGKRKTTDYESVKEWESQCYLYPSYGERLMCAINEIIGGYGVDAIYKNDGDGTPAFEYVDMGDPYTVTILRNMRTGRITVGAWGDIVERWN